LSACGVQQLKTYANQLKLNAGVTTSGHATNNNIMVNAHRTGVTHITAELTTATHLAKEPT